MTEQVNAPVDGKSSDSSEYIEAMVNKADGGTNTNTDENETLLAGKYKTEEELHKGIIELAKKREGGLEGFYKELESSIGKKPEVNKPEGDKPEGDEPESNEPESEPDPNRPFDKYTKEFNETGTISEASLEELDKIGISKDMVDSLMEGINNRVKQFQDRVGGPDNYTKMVEWAKQNLSTNETRIYDEAMASGDADRINMAIDSLGARYNKAEGTPPNTRISPNTSSTNLANDGYESRAQMVVDMSNPKYQKDPAFRNMVMQKIQNSKIF